MKKRVKNTKLFLGKQAVTNEIYHILIQILIAVIIFFILQSYIDSVEKNTIFEKSYLAKDIGLLINTIYTGAGTSQYSYTNERAELHRFEFEFMEQKLKVSESQAKSKIEAYQPYAEDKSLPLTDTALREPTILTFSKNKDKIQIEQGAK